MVVFINGVPSKTDYRKFKMRLPGNDDFAHMAEAIKRRLDGENIKKWGTPDLVLIDGGKGQLSTAIGARDAAGQSKIPMIGLAKRFEEIIVPKDQNFAVVMLPENSHLVKLLQRIRDESHRFAAAYHSTLRSKRQTASLLDDVPGIGPVTRKKLIRHFGSMRALFAADELELQKVLGPKAGKTIAKYLAAIKN
jgi:excinuclease ABC subunit C